MAGPYRILSSERLYVSVFCALRRDEVEFPGGERGFHHVVEIPNSAVVVPVLDDGSIVFVRQYRYALDADSLELPAGRVGEGETPLAAARRELEEEAGYRASRLLEAGSFHPLSGISPHRASVFVARDLEPTRTAHEPSERIAVETISAEETLARLRSGEIRDGFSIVALARYFLFSRAG